MIPQYNKFGKAGRRFVARVGLSLLSLLILNLTLTLFNPTSLAVMAAQTEEYGLGRQPGGPRPQTAPTVVTVRANLPVSTDYTAYLPPVGNQGSQGSCVAWATGYYYKTFQEGRKFGWPINTSQHQFSPAFIYNQINGGSDAGSYPYSAMELMKTKGATTLSDFPYKSSDYTTQPTAAQLANAANYKAADHAYLFYSNPAPIDVLRQQLANGDLFVIGFPVYHEFDRAANNSTYIVTHDKTNSETPRGYHEITVVGYDDSRQAFRIVNSWGSGWGNGGFTWMSYDFVRDFTLDGSIMSNRNQLGFSVYPTGSNTGTGSAQVSFTTNRPTTTTIKQGTTTLATDTTLATSHSISVTGLPTGKSDIVVGVTDASGEFASASSRVETGGQVVTESEDTGDTNATGTLSFALQRATSGQFITFAPGVTQVMLKGNLPPLLEGVTVQGGTSAASPIRIDGSDPAAPTDGLTLNGNNYLAGLKFVHFRGKPLNIVGKKIRLWNVTVSKM